jgi:hypothetical protein
MLRICFVKINNLFLSIAALTLVHGTSSTAQNFASGGASWSGSWGFGTANDHNVAISQAQTIRNAEQGAAVVSQSTYNTNYDNRTNYVDAQSSVGDVVTDLQVGDNIGENTYAVGSLNTGSTTISVEGSDNIIDAINSADTTGCTDASILNVTSEDAGRLPARSC